MTQIINGREVERGSVEIDGIGNVRFYKDVDSGIEHASVTSIKDTRWTPDKDEGIQSWKNYRDGPKGTGQHWEDIRDFKGHRGTLAHYACLDPLAERELYGDEEAESEQWIGDFGDYRGVDAQDKALRGVSWATNQFETVVDEVGISNGTVMEVEQYVWHDDPPFGGQYDLLYETADGTTRLCDLKTSKLKLNGDYNDETGDTAKAADIFDTASLTEDAWSRLEGYALQLSAYQRGCDFDIDECEVIWLSPDTHNVRVVRSDDLPRTMDSYWREFAGLSERASQSLLRDYEDSDESACSDSPSASHNYEDTND